MTNLDFQRATQQLTSIVIPVLNEESQIAATLANLEAVTRGQLAEVIVADGGSTDRTVELTSQLEGVRIVNCPQANRGWQMNEGAASARGDILLFLHADVTLPPNSLASIRQSLVDASIVGGVFSDSISGRRGGFLGGGSLRNQSAHAIVQNRYGRSGNLYSANRV